MKAINGLMAYDCAGVDESVDDDGRWLMMNKTELGELKYAEFGLSLRIPLCLPAFFSIIVCFSIRHVGFQAGYICLRTFKLLLWEFGPLC